MTPGPTASITPALSVPIPEGNDLTACWPRRTSMSRKLSATAVCRIRTSPGPGSGSGTSSKRSTSGPPCRSKRNAFMARVIARMERAKKSHSGTLAAEPRPRQHDRFQSQMANWKQARAGERQRPPRQSRRGGDDRAGPRADPRAARARSRGEARSAAVETNDRRHAGDRAVQGAAAEALGRLRARHCHVFRSADGAGRGRHVGRLGLWRGRRASLVRRAAETTGRRRTSGARTTTR